MRYRRELGELVYLLLIKTLAVLLHSSKTNSDFQNPLNHMVLGIDSLGYVLKIIVP